MPIMTTRVTNATFESTNSAEYASVDDAYRAAIVAGIDIAAGEVKAGSTSSIVQVAVDLGGQRNVMRGAVSVATARCLSVPST